jgi:hypothetical protein
MNAEVFQFVERARAITFVNQALAPIRKPAISFLSAWPSIPQDSDCDQRFNRVTPALESH